MKVSPHPSLRTLQSGARLLGLLRLQGPVAQSGERRPRMAEVTSSSLVGSTYFFLDLQVKRREQKWVPVFTRDPLLQPYCNPLTQRFFEGAGGTVLHVGEHVRVGVESYGDRSVS
jgi:hypothetical protein